MKQTIVIILFLSHYLLASAQDNRTETLLQTNTKNHIYYVDLQESEAYVYRIGRIYDKAAAEAGYLPIKTDTLVKQSDNTYIHENTKLIYVNNKLYLITKFKKTKKFQIDTVKNLGVANHNLNNAYYLSHYFEMSRELNQKYPLSDQDFRNGFYTWKKLPNKEINYLQFRTFADKQMKATKDSISTLEDSHVALTNYALQNIRSFAYDTLKHYLTQLPVAYRSYYSTIITEVAKQKPEYFFRLAEDFPTNKYIFFSAYDDNKEVIQGLKSVVGHDDIKKEFFKDRRFGKTMIYRIIAPYAIMGGLLAWLIIAQP